MKLTCILLATSFYTASMTTLSYGQELTEPYLFTVRPGTKEWKVLNNHADMIESCQIPSYLIKEYDTKALLKTCLSYPLLLDMFSYDDLNIGLNKTLIQFNGYNELINRINFIDILTDYYIHDIGDIGNIDSVDDIEAGKLSF